jgi:hypothetical protein
MTVAKEKNAPPPRREVQCDGTLSCQARHHVGHCLSQQVQPH